ncbi:hypothetical protein Tco_0606292 [Tanacetum coccineum]
MHPGKSQSEHIDEFHKLVGDLAAIDTAISDEDRALLLLTSLPSSYDYFMEILLYGRDTLKLEDVLAILNFRELQKMTEAKGDGGEGLCVRGRSDHVSAFGAEGYDNADVMMAMSVEELECRVCGTGKVQVQMRDGSSFVLDNVRNMCFNESGEYKKTFIGSGVGTGSVHVLQGVEFEGKPQEDHIFEVEPHGNVDHVAGSQEVQTQDLIYYPLAFACEVISKWKAVLKDDMDARSNVYVLSNGCRKCSDDNNIYYWEYTSAKGNVLGMEIVRDQSGNTLRVSQSRFYNGKLVHTLLEGHFILSLEGSLSGDCDVEKNGKWSCIYAVGNQEYQMVCTRLYIASADVGMLDKFDRGLQTDVQVFVDFDYAMEAAKEAIWLKGLAIESEFELKIVAGIATRALSKAVPRSRLRLDLKLLRIEDF